jgi:hypothetical protein
MTTVMRWSVCVVLAAVVGLVAPAASFAADIILQDGAKAIIDDNHKLFIVDKAGKRTLAKDGTFRTKDGKSIVVQRGIVVQDPGAEKGIVVQNPGAQGQKVVPRAAQPSK